MTTRIVLCLCLALALAASHWKVHVMTDKSVRAEWAQANAKAESTARSLETERARVVQKAKNEQAKRIQTVSADAAGSRDELERLRIQIGRGNNASGEPTCAANQRADTLGELLKSCAAEYQDVARRADGHALDAVTLRDAWPK